jgi:hypothetical protein
LVEQKRGGEQVHVVPSPAERGGKAVVVRRREAERVDERDAHGRYPSLERR